MTTPGLLPPLRVTGRSLHGCVAPDRVLALTGDPKTGPFAIEARTAKTDVYVRFEVDGAAFRTEKIAKFCLFGGGANGSACNTGTLSAGTHVIKAKLVSSTTNLVLAEAQTSVSR